LAARSLSPGEDRATVERDSVKRRNEHLCAATSALRTPRPASPTLARSTRRRQAQSGFVAIDFTTATTSGNAQAGRTAGTFTSTGRVRDAGRMTTA